MSSTFFGLLAYCLFDHESDGPAEETTVRGELIYAQQVELQAVRDASLTNGAGEQRDLRFDIRALAKQMQTQAGLCQQVRKPVWHQVFSFPVGEEPACAQEQAIIEEWMKTFGFVNNQVVAFRHREKDHIHFHIVANRVSMAGINTSIDGHNYRETGRLCRRLEAKHQLTLTVGMYHDRPGGRLESRESVALDTLRASIDSQLSGPIDQQQFIKGMYGTGYKVLINRGITFIDRTNGSKVKGSELGRSYSWQAIQNRMTREAGPRVTDKSYQVSQRSAQLRQQLLSILPAVSTPLELRWQLAERHGIVSYYQDKDGQLSLHDEADGKLVLGYSVAGQLRFMPVTRLLDQPLEKILLSASATMKGDETSLLPVYDTIYTAMLATSFRYQKRRGGDAAAVAGAVMATTNWRIAGVATVGGGQEVGATLLSDRTQPGDAAGSVLHRLGGRGLATALHMANQPQVQTNTAKPTGVADGTMVPTQRTEPTVWAQGGAQMDRDTRADVSEIERSLAALRQERSATQNKPKAAPGQALQPSTRRPRRRL